jgi:hypothetical protein
MIITSFIPNTLPVIQSADGFSISIKVDGQPDAKGFLLNSGLPSGITITGDGILTVSPNQPDGVYDVEVSCVLSNGQTITHKY